MRHIRLIFKRPTSGDIVFQAAFTRADGTTTYTEESPYALTGTFAGPAAINLNSLDLTGGTGYVTFPGVQNINTTALVPFTIDLKVAFSSFALSSTRYVIGQYDSTNNQRAWAITQNTDQLRFIYSSNGTGFSTLTCISSLSNTFTVNDFVSIRIDYDGTTIRFYANGDMFASAAYASRFFSSNAPLAFGVRSDLAAGSEWQGRIDDVRIIRGIALTASDAGYFVSTSQFMRTTTGGYLYSPARDRVQTGTGD